MEMAAVMPRSLKEPVGLSPSTLSQTSAPVRPESHSECTSGVPPSRSVTACIPSGRSSSSRYSSITPRHWWVMADLDPLIRRPLDPHHRGDLADDVHVAQLLDRRGQGGVGSGVRDDDELGIGPSPLLPHGLDRHAVVGERVGDPASTPARSSTSIATW